MDYRLLAIGCCSVCGWLSIIAPPDERPRVFSEDAPGVREDAPAVQAGEKLFQTRCFVCHGRDGKGDGPSSTSLAEKPQDLTDPNWQRSTPDERLHLAIQGGGLAIGRSDAMPPNSDLTEEQIQSLIAYVRSLAGRRGGER